LVIFRAKLVEDCKIARFQEKGKKIIKKNISERNPKKFRVDASSTGD
jgi:hypothetical protein